MEAGGGRSRGSDLITDKIQDISRPTCSLLQVIVNTISRPFTIIVYSKGQLANNSN